MYNTRNMFAETIDKRQEFRQWAALLSEQYSLKDVLDDDDDDDDSRTDQIQIYMYPTVGINATTMQFCINKCQLRVCHLGNVKPFGAIDVPLSSWCEEFESIAQKNFRVVQKHRAWDVSGLQCELLQ